MWHVAKMLVFFYAINNKIPFENGRTLLTNTGRVTAPVGCSVMRHYAFKKKKLFEDATFIGVYRCKANFLQNQMTLFLWKYYPTI